jgi:intracellular sulfur oxidation DsrE/DsrF family protein
MSLVSTLGAAGLLHAFAAPLAGASPTTPRETWDTSWVKRLTRPHRVVFDVTKINDGTAFWQSTSWMQGYAETENTTDADVNVVLVLRHEAVRMALNDAMWARLTSDGTSSAKRNPWLGDTAADSASSGGMPGQVTLRKLMARGVIALACNNALNGQAFTLKTKEGVSEPDAQAQLRASVANGIYVVPNGVFAVGRAQEAGCALFIAG